MAKSRIQFVCRRCGSVHPKWLGKCPDCGTWDALERIAEPPPQSGAEAEAAKWIPTAELAEGDPGGEGVGPRDGVPQRLEEISVADVPRLRTGIAELDRALGGGVVPGSVILLGGDPGIGKSTLLLQGLAGLAARSERPDRPILYVSSEESARQVRLRADRLLTGWRGDAEDGAAASSAAVGVAANPTTASPMGAPPGLFVLAETNLARIGEQIRRLRPAACAIDSIQMIHRPDLDAAPGSVSQIRRCCTDLVYLAKRSGMPVIVVGHVTKDGHLAGPKLLEHLVDVVLSFEGDRHHAHRVVRALKNRFGSTQEIGLFEMTAAGMREPASAAPSAEAMASPPVGTALCATILGTRCLLAEIEALTATGVLGNARRKASGIDANRLAMLIAVLEKHGGLRLADQDVFASSAGGLRTAEPGADLAIALAIAGVHYGRSVPAGSVAFGEVGLTGRLRPVPHLELRVREAVRRGAETLLVPAAMQGDVEQIARAAAALGPGSSAPLVQVVGLRGVAEAIALLESAPRPGHIGGLSSPGRPSPDRRDPARVSAPPGRVRSTG